MEDLVELRGELDKIDREIVKLFEERMEVSRKVAEYKIESGKKVLDRERELQKLHALGMLAHSDFNRHGVQELFQQIMSIAAKSSIKCWKKKACLVVFRLRRSDIWTGNTAEWCIRAFSEHTVIRLPVNILERMSIVSTCPPGVNAWRRSRREWRIMRCFPLRILLPVK